MEQRSIPVLLRVAPLIAFLVVPHAIATTSQQVQERVSAELKQGKPVVVHVVVALCDNIHQGIVPVPSSLGNGQDPESNLYWGAAYGVRTYFPRRAGYELHRPQQPRPDGVLDRIVLHKTITRSGKPVDVFVVADAWDGQRIKGAIDRFLEFAAGTRPVDITVEGVAEDPPLKAGGQANLVAFVGHNGLMDFLLSSIPEPSPKTQPRSSVVLACASDPFFSPVLETGGSHPLLLTTGLMAPEAYTLEATIAAFVSGADPSDVRQAAANAYNKYQKCGSKAALRLFSTN